MLLPSHHDDQEHKGLRIESNENRTSRHLGALEVEEPPDQGVQGIFIWNRVSRHAPDPLPTSKRRKALEPFEMRLHVETCRQNGSMPVGTSWAPENVSSP